MSHGVAHEVLRSCFAQGVREFVVCAGARNASLVLGLARTPGIEVWSHFEERSAAFFALGRVVATGRPVAVVTTSGTAAAELLPAVIEAHYQGRPLLVVTADRPSSFRGSGAPQSIEQVGLFGRYVEGCDDLEDGASEAEFPMAAWSRRQPWHVNVCLPEDGPVPVLPEPREEVAGVTMPRPPVVELVRFLERDVFRGLVVLLGGLEPEEREDVLHFLRDLAVPVVADATSGLREALGPLALIGGDELLRRKPPGKVLRIGDVPVGRFWRDLESRPEIEVLSITRTGFSGLARPSGVIHGMAHHVVRGTGGAPKVGDVLDLLPRSAKKRGRLDELLERFPDSEPAMVRLLSTYVTMGESLFLGNSLPIREWNLCAQRQVPIAEVLANRGANGIDGQLSTWLGATADQPGAWGVFGDLTVLYDLSAPALMEGCLRAGRVLCVINNQGGQIFRRLPRLQGLVEPEQQIITNAHRIGFREWAAMWNLDYVVAAARDEFDVEPAEQAIALELRPDPAQTEQFWEAWAAES